MKNKDYSKLLKLLIVVLAVVASVMKWYGILGNATITEIWQVAAMAYAVSLGTMDFNICVDNWKEQKDGSAK
jgi:hypothetical protein